MLIDDACRGGATIRFFAVGFATTSVTGGIYCDTLGFHSPKPTAP
jgi:hypothetical protein